MRNAQCAAGGALILGSLILCRALFACAFPPTAQCWRVLGFFSWLFFLRRAFVYLGADFVSFWIRFAMLA